METLEDEESTITDDRSKSSFPDEIIEDILSRLPVKSILRFKSVSKPWLSLISAPSFHKLHSTICPRTTSLFFSAYDTSTKTRYFFSGARDGGSVANLMKLDNTVFDLANTYAEHLNGLVFFTSRDSLFGKLYAFVFNPTTHKLFKLPDPPGPLRNYTDENKETITFPPPPQVSDPIWGRWRKCFKSIELTLGHRFLSPKSVSVEQIKCYVESLIPLQN